MSRKGMVLKPEYQEVADEFWFTFRDRGCTCFISPPCSHCTHEGNPANLEEDDDAWESELIGAVQDAASVTPTNIGNPLPDTEGKQA